MAVVNDSNIGLNSETTNEQKEDNLGAETKSARRRTFLLNGTSKDDDGDIAPPPSPPPALPPSISSSPSSSPSGSPPPSGSDEEEEKKLDLEEAVHEKGGSKASSTESGFSSSVTNSTEATAVIPDNETSKSTPDLTITRTKSNRFHSDSYPPIPPIPSSETALAPLPPPLAARRSKSTGILNYPAGHPRSRAYSLPAGAQDEESVQGHLHSASCSSSSCNVKFAPLPQLAPRKRKSNTPLGVAARGQMMKQRRARMMGGDPDAQPPQPNGGDVRRAAGGGMWTEDELDAHANRIAAAEARHRAMNSDEYLDEDAEEMDDPFLALGRIVKGAWKKMSKGKKGPGKENEDVGTTTNANSNAGPPQVQLQIGEQASGKPASMDSARQSATLADRANDEKDGRSEPLPQT